MTASSLFRSRALLGLALAAVSAAAAADTLTLNFDLTPNGMERTYWGKDLGIVRFNPVLGTLTGIDLHLQWAGELSGSVRNLSASPNGVYVQHDLIMGLSDLNDVVIDSEIMGSADFGALLPVGGTGSYGPVTVSGVRDLSVASSNPLASRFVGTGTVDLRVFAYGHTEQPADGPIQTDVDTFASAKGSVTYHYAPVPEPASMTALGLGALGLLRRRNKNGGAR